MKTVKIEDSWYERLKDEFSSEYFAELKKFLVADSMLSIPHLSTR